LKRSPSTTIDSARGWTRLPSAIAGAGALALGIEHVASWLGGDRLIATVLVLVLFLFVVPFIQRAISHGASR
jgi:4-amino-4-deoxy-L-arabinose transferase-like glycosyltransferase